jgi:hypothetical protein
MTGVTEAREMAVAGFRSILRTRKKKLKKMFQDNHQADYFQTDQA